MTYEDWLKAYEENAISAEIMLKEAAILIKEIAEYCQILRKREAEIQRLQYQIKNVTKQIEFLKGQIKAYQYCMNCRR